MSCRDPQPPRAFSNLLCWSLQPFLRETDSGRDREPKLPELGRLGLWEQRIQAHLALTCQDAFGG